MAKTKITQKVERLERRIKNLTAQKDRYYKEMIERGKEVSCMMRIFIIVKDILPEGPRERIEKICTSYAKRNDKGRNCNRPDSIDFRDLEMRGENRRRSEKVSELNRTRF